MSITTAESQIRDRPESLLGIIRVYRRHLMLFALVGSTIFAAMLAFTLLQTPRYTATASVIIAPRKVEVGADGGGTDPTTDASVDTQVEVLKSRALAETVVDRLQLDLPQAFTTAFRPNNASLRFLRLAKSKPVPADPRGRREEAVEAIQSGMDVGRVGQTLALKMSYVALNPHLATQVANAYADAYIGQSANLKLADARTANRLLTAQLADLRNQVEAAETAVGRYRTSNNLLSVQGSSLPEQEITALDQQVATARASEAESGARLNTARQQLETGSNGEDVGEALGSPVVQELRRQRADVSRHLADLEGRYGPRYPELVDTRRQIADTDRQIQSEVRRIISNLEAQHQVAGRRAGSLQTSLSSAKGQLATASAASIRLNELQRSADAVRTLYEGVLNRVRQTEAQQALAESDARINNYATPASVTKSPNLPINLLIGFLLAVGAAIAAVVVRQGLDTGITTLDEVERRLGVRYFGGLPTVRSSIPHVGGAGPAEVMDKHAFSGFAEAFRSLAAELLHSCKDQVRTIAITSALPKEGKSTTAICLGQVLALSDARVILVDCDLRQPSIARSLKLQPKVGLLEVLTGLATLDEAIMIDQRTGLAVLPVVKATFTRTSPFETDALDRMLEELKARYQTVILDSPPVLPIIDSRLLARKADVVMLVVRWRKTPEKAARLAIRLLESLNVHIGGAALTQIDLHAQARSGYGDPSYYHGAYREYYAG